jgi:hypothetical protein
MQACKLFQATRLRPHQILCHVCNRSRHLSRPFAAQETSDRHSVTLQVFLDISGVTGATASAILWWRSVSDVCNSAVEWSYWVYNGTIEKRRFNQHTLEVLFKELATGAKNGGRAASCRKTSVCWVWPSIVLACQGTPRSRFSFMKEGVRTHLHAFHPRQPSSFSFTSWGLLGPQVRLRRLTLLAVREGTSSLKAALLG